MVMESTETETYIELSVGPYSSPNVVIDTAIIMANWHGKSVKFVLKGTTMFVLPGDKVKNVAGEWVDFTNANYLESLNDSKFKKWSDK